jgi:hypothetical protein
MSNQAALLVLDAGQVPNETKVFLQLPFSDGVRRIGESDVTFAIAALKATDADLIKQTLGRVRSPLAGCDYHQILARYLDEARSHPYASQFATAKGAAPRKAAFLLALERQLDAERFARRAEVLKSWQLIQRFVRDSVMAREVKKLYDWRCQLGCGPLTASKLEVPYVEGAHIQPLHKGGPDEKANLLCLCPNHHVLLDYGAFYIDETNHPRWSLADDVRPPFERPLEIRHEIDPEVLEFHRAKIANVG